MIGPQHDLDGDVVDGAGHCVTRWASLRFIGRGGRLVGIRHQEKGISPFGQERMTVVAGTAGSRVVREDVWARYQMPWSAAWGGRRNHPTPRRSHVRSRFQNSFSPILDRYFGQVHGYVARRLGDSLADDVAAETFLATAMGVRECPSL